MKLALPTFAAAMGLYLAALTVPFEREGTGTEVAPLDLDGVEVVVVEGDAGAYVDFSSRQSPQAEVRGRPLPQLRAVRRGHALFITVTGPDGPRTAWLTLPPTVRRLEMATGNVSAGREPGLAALDLQVRGPVEFTGDVEALRITSLGGDDTCRGYCPGVDVSAGRIGDLRVASQSLAVHLAAPDGLGRVHVQLGPKARLRVGDTVRIDHIRLERVDRVDAADAGASGADARAATAPPTEAAAPQEAAE